MADARKIDGRAGSGQPRWFRLAALVLLLFTAPVGASRGGDSSGPRIGLWWNRSGLPAVFPLQIVSPAGRDYHVLLSDAETGDDALAAYFRGGTFFRILVPPGNLNLEIAHGTEWLDDEGKFAPGALTGRVSVGPLDFRVAGAARKEGHLIRLEPAGSDTQIAATVRGFAFCQTFGSGDMAPPVLHLERRAGLPPLSPPSAVGPSRLIQRGPPSLTQNGPPSLMPDPPEVARHPPLWQRSDDRRWELRSRVCE